METVSVTQLMSETDIIDSLFHTCDSENVGTVPVSSLITYLERVTDMHQKHKKAVQTLSECLDPLGLDADVDLETYRQGMHRWIERLRCDHIRDSGVEEEVMPQNKILSASMQIAVCSPQNRVREFGIMSLAYPVTQHNSSEFKERDTADLQEQMEELQNTIRRLSQENNKLQAQLDVHEDSITALNEEKASLMEKIHRLQEVVELQSEIVAENEELKATVIRYQDQIKDFEHNINRKEKENIALATQLSECEAQLSKVNEEEETSQQLVKDLKASLQNLKAYFQNIFEAKRSHEIELASELKANNRELLLRLAHLQQNLNSLQQQNQQQSGLLAPTRSHSSDNSDEDGVILTSHPGSTSGSTRSSTSASIHSEIKELRQPLVCQLPLCAKEQKEMLDGGVTVFSTSGDQTEVPGFVDDFEHAIDSILATIPEDVLDGLENSSQVDLPENVARSSSQDRGIMKDASKDATFSHNSATSFRLRRFFALIKGLKEENERLRQIHDGVLNTMLSDPSSEGSVVTPDSRVVVLRDLLLEERTQKVQLQQQVKLLKNKCSLSHSDHEDAGFKYQEDILALQLQKIQQLEKSNLLLSEKYHKAELKITDLQEEALQAAFKLEREKSRCAKLEDSLSTSTLARQLDLRDIWRLVQKDVETEYLDFHEDSGISSSTEELKEKILQEIKARQDELGVQHETHKILSVSHPFGSPKKSCSHSKTRTRCCDRSLSSGSSPLVDALTIDFFNGNYYPMAKKSQVSDPYLNYLRMSCEDVDCMACRAVRLGLEFHGMSSCPSLQLKFGHDRVGLNAATTLDYNFNSRSNFSPNMASHTMVGTDGSQLNYRQNAVPVLTSTTSSPAQHRRLEFVRSCERWTSGTTDSVTSTSMDSNSNSDVSSSRALPCGGVCAPSAWPRERANNEQAKPASCAGQSSPAGFRRMSFLAAVDKSESERHRRPSYRAAIDRRFLGLDGGATVVDNHLDRMEGHGQGDGPQTSGGRTENKSVTFQLEGNYSYAHIHGNQHVPSSSNVLHSDVDSSATWISMSAPSARAAGGQVRKLSILVEEDGEDVSRSPDRMSPSSPRVKCPSPLRKYAPAVLDRMTSVKVAIVLI
ncbi:uncharacterized protein LOC112566096 isoform X3 [Pomacea canaliculata]|uniref:uncharacterized protein LOC112566096 isoform X3 n=1 Tax=Pomacea canaliculata TaxID=400727 RepID=UPI000D72C1C6|nr:uncharacterized protein LOC112566096 isoform X3 [Pomacea canaliculata]